jgi:hypothetical protein
VFAAKRIRQRLPCRLVGIDDQNGAWAAGHGCDGDRA